MTHEITRNPDGSINVRCRAFTGFSLAVHRVMVGLDDGGERVRVYDSIAGHYTTCHALSARTQRRIVKIWKEDCVRLAAECDDLDS